MFLDIAHVYLVCDSCPSEDSALFSSKRQTLERGSRTTASLACDAMRVFYKALKRSGE